MMIRRDTAAMTSGTIERLEKGISAGQYQVSIRRNGIVTYYAIFRELERAVENYETMFHFTTKELND